MKFRLGILGLLVTLAACSGSETSDPEDTTNDTSQDTATDAEGDASEDPDAEDAGELGDAVDDTDDTSVIRGDYGDPCVEDNDCQGNLCLYIQTGLEEGFCSSYCFEREDCPADAWDCIFLQNSGGDAAFLCAPENLCLDQDEDGYGIGPGCAGPDCDEADDATYLGADELCDGVDNDCDGAIDDNPIEAGDICETGFAGECARGLLSCNSGRLDCNALIQGSDEICDGRDNDCDGFEDEGADGGLLEITCYQGQPATIGVGECREGAQVCRDGVIGGCEDQVLPLPELCDGLDNDCDGEADEGSPEAGVYCETGLPGVCRRGQTSCADNTVSCIPLDTASDELCDGVDNDCDGEIDEGVDGEPMTEACYSGDPSTENIGTCAGGLRTCRSGDWSRCEGEVTPTIELCSSSDEDCDGEVNEGSPASGFLCETGELGLCAFGRTECGSAAGTECIPDYDPVDEICDAFDNDCDGEVDENASGDAIARDCYDGEEGTEGVGLCRGGAQTCAFGGWSGCADQVLPQIEICDGLDNDCDGEVDEGNPGGGVACTTGEPGICAAGASVCEDGEVVCQQTNVPTAETCDGIDNDCDGTIDNGALWSNLSTGCFDGNGACRAAGVYVCDPSNPAGPSVCGAEPGDPSTEVCDGIDNDCDGATDEGPMWSGVGAVCNAGVGSCRAIGVFSCDPANPAGPPVCGAEAGAPSTEVCDGLDNDCDGDTDEGALWAAAGTVCTAGEGVCRAAGVFACDPSNPSGPLECGASEGAPSAEVCDGLDNDCDGNTDENFPTLNQSCTAGEGVCRAAGVVVCDGPSGVMCDAEVREPPTAFETACDYIDDDCDGMVDEDFRTGAIYASDAHCGGCGVACTDLWDGGPEAYNVVPVCSVFTMVASCDYDCVPGYHDLDADPSNGCEFTPDDGAIYVSTPANGGSNGGSCGTFDNPCATIGYAINNRAVPNGFERVRVSDGLFNEDVVLVDNVSVLGGHNSINWVRRPTVNVTALSGRSTGLDNAAVRAENISSPTEFSGFTVSAAPGGAGGGNSIGIYVRDSNNNLEIRDNRVFSANGGSGAAGSNGVAGVSGNDGANGTRRVYLSPGCSGTSLGGGGGSATCVNPGSGSTTNVSGGRGGNASCPSYPDIYDDPDTSVPSESGRSGNGPAGGGGGTGGDAFYGSGNTCYSPDDPSEGGEGANGAPGTDGTGGGGAPATGMLSAGQWRGGTGAAGGHGAHGSGGGGGGAAGGVDAGRSESEYYRGATGGGGGAGGCAGSAGQGGFAGGGSFPILITFSTPPAGAGALPVVVDNDLARATGGTGGRGGGGGGGGSPGEGAFGGPPRSDGTSAEHFDFCILSGGKGGTGGRGGHGGGGGGGGGGASFDILVAGVGGISPNYASTNIFSVDDSEATGGVGGLGGVSTNPSNDGAAGSSGQSGNLATMP